MEYWINKKKKVEGKKSDRTLGTIVFVDKPCNVNDVRWREVVMV